MTAPRFVVGVDGSDASCEALHWTAALAESFGADVVAVHAVGLLEDVEVHDVPGQEHLAGRRRVVETTWCAPLAGAGFTHRVELRDGPALDVLLQAARDERADLLVVGSRGTGPDPARALGSTSLHVLQAAEVPVLVVPAPGTGGPEARPSPRSVERVLVGVDRSPPSLVALDLAADVAGVLGGSLSVVEVVEYVPAFPLGPATSVTCEGEEDAPERTRVLLESAVRGLRDRGLRVQVVVRSGEPAPVLLDLAEDIDADLVVVGTRGRGDPADPALGSVARTVADRVRRPTLVVPAAAGAVRLRPVSRPTGEPAGG
ncbi:MAG TPA: universal stress protein [Acidimicrobiales bacterium]|nr:universal stress protein [Acidimicrobiales bacterium]